MIKKTRIRKPKYTIEQIKKAFEKVGCKLLEKTYTSSQQLLKYKCKCGAVRVACYNNFSRYPSCKLCYLKRHAQKWAENRKKADLVLVLREQHFSIQEVADILGVPYGEFYRPVALGLLPAPTHKMPGRSKLFYNENDVEKIRDLIYIEVKSQKSKIKKLGKYLNLQKTQKDKMIELFGKKEEKALLKFQAKEAEQKVKMKILFEAKKARSKIQC